MQILWMSGSGWEISGLGKKKPAKMGWFRELAMGFEPTTFCLGSSDQAVSRQNAVSSNGGHLSTPVETGRTTR
jgi:hypothetical protein